MQINMVPYAKFIVLKVDMFQTEIIDEKNFDFKDIFGIESFKRKYDNSKYKIIRIDM